MLKQNLQVQLVYWNVTDGTPAGENGYNQHVLNQQPNLENIGTFSTKKTQSCLVQFGAPRRQDFVWRICKFM